MHARSLVALAAASALAAGAARAQTPAQTRVTPAQLPYLQTFSLDPLAIPLGIISAEYEVSLPTPGFTLGVGGTFTAGTDPFRGDDDRWVEGRAMYYPSEVALKGFAVGLTVGAHRASYDKPKADEIKHQAGPTLGVLGSYNYLVGSQQRLVVGLGAGVKRVLKNVHSDSPLQQVYPDGRILIGIAF